MLLMRNLSVLPPLTQGQTNQYRDGMGELLAIESFGLSYYFIFILFHSILSKSLACIPVQENAVK